MTHYYDKITGWFDWELINELAVQRAINGDTFLELGTANGKSTAHLAIEIAKSGKNIQLITVDIFGDTNQKEYVLSHLGKFDFVQVVKSDSIDFLKYMTSGDVVPKFKYIFLDDCHDYDHVLKEIDLAMLLLDENGIMAGHDFSNLAFQGVAQAVLKSFKSEDLKFSNLSWIYGL